MIGLQRQLDHPAFCFACPDVTGLDTDPAMLSHAKAYASKKQYVEGNSLCLPFSDTSFDLVFQSQRYVLSKTGSVP